MDSGRKYGSVMFLHFGSKPVIIVQSADGAMEIMKTHDLAFADKPLSSTVRRLLYELKNISVAPYGEYWRKLKSLCVLKLLNSKKVQSFRFIREEETALLMEKIKSSCGLGVNLSEIFVSISNDVVCRSTFGKRYSSSEDGKKFLMVLIELAQLLGSLNVAVFIPSLWWIDHVTGFNARVDKVSKQIDYFLDQVIQEHLNAQEVVSGASDDSAALNLGGQNRESFAKMLLEIYKDNTTGVSIDRDNVKAIILDLMLGGTDTSSATLEWAMTELLRHPTVMKKLQDEVRGVLEDKHDNISDDDLDKMQYLKAVVRETLRYHTPVPFLAREAREDVEVMGYEIKAGTMVIINAWAIGRDPICWDEPEKFQPERFLNSSIDFMGLDYELIPFGAGRRRCPGIGFAMASVELVLANLMQKFDWELPNGTKSQDLDTIEHPDITIHRKNPLFAVPTHCYF